MTSLIIKRVLAAPGPSPAGMAWDGESLWLNDYQLGQLIRYDILKHKAMEQLLCPGVISGLTWDGRRLWQTRMDESLLQPIDPVHRNFDPAIAVPSYRRLGDAAFDGGSHRVRQGGRPRLRRARAAARGQARRVAGRPRAGRQGARAVERHERRGRRGAARRPP